MTTHTVESEIDEFIERSRALTGREVRERDAWNTDVSRDAIRHYAFGTSDGNPLWLDPEHASRSRYGRRSRRIRGGGMQQQPIDRGVRPFREHRRLSDLRVGGPLHQLHALPWRA